MTKQKNKWQSRKFLLSAAVVVVMFLITYHTAGPEGWQEALTHIVSALGGLTGAGIFVKKEADVDAANAGYRDDE